jgi:hypothetical protein
VGLMGAVAETVAAGLGEGSVIGVIPAALAPREVRHSRASGSSKLLLQLRCALLHAARLVPCVETHCNKALEVVCLWLLWTP